MKEFAEDFNALIHTLEKGEGLTEKQALEIKLFLIEIDIVINGFVELAQFHKNQHKRWDGEANRLCIYRNMIREKQGVRHEV